MRQAGVLAAAGIIALEKMVHRLTEDHERARRLGEGLRQVPGVELEHDVPETNMVFFRIAGSLQISANQLEQALRQQGILVHATGPRNFRLVTHYWIDDAAIERTIAALRGALHQA